MLSSPCTGRAVGSVRVVTPSGLPTLLLLLLSFAGSSGCGVTTTATSGGGSAADISLGNRGSEPVSSSASRPPTLWADLAPTTALAWSDPFLWIGSQRGLRRIRLPGGPAEWIGGGAGFPGRSVSALAVDRAGRIVIATESGVGRLFAVAAAANAAAGAGAGARESGAVRHQSLVSLPNVTHLAPVLRDGPGDAIWAGTPTGLFLLDGGRATPMDAVRGVEITSLDLDTDGKSVWAGTRSRGLYHVDASGVTASIGPKAGPGSSEEVDFVDVIGTALLANGTRIAVGRAAHGGARIVLLRMGGPELLVAQPDVSVVAVASRPGGPALLAGPESAPLLYNLEIVERGETVDQGFRFVPARKSLQGVRLAARRAPRVAPPEVTMAVSGGADGDDIFIGTRSAGVARLGARRSDGVEYLPVGELALDARGLSVACLDSQRCIFSTGTGPGWIWDGRAGGGAGAVSAIPAGSLAGGLMALAGDGAGPVYAVTGGKGKTLTITRLASGGAHWDPIATLPVSTEGSPVVTFATLSPRGNLWLALRDRVASGQEFGRGLIEVQLPAARAIHHRPYRENDEAPPEAIALVGDVSAVRFRKPTETDPETIWFCTSVGVSRFVGGQLSHWGENEGLDSERCHDMEITGDGTVWIATEEGIARFDGKNWHRFESAAGGASLGKSASASVPRWPVNREGESLAGRALVIVGRELWAGTPRGIWPVAGSTQTQPRPIDRGSPDPKSRDPKLQLADDDVTDLVADRFGRLWVLGHAGVTILAMPAG